MTAEEILQDAVEIATPVERAAYLESACGQDRALRAHVEGLLKAHDNAGSFLEQPLFESSPNVDGPPVSESPGAVIGPYKLLEQIGEGGFGVVFLAEQTQPVRRQVALKVLKAGMDTRQVVARFEAERQALAIMDHPNIARVFDGGSTEPDAQARAAGVAPLARASGPGRPYFVMELVKGVPITEFCDQNQLTPRQRLELFIPVCQAVQHAHQKGIIHRDLKPSNVLVTPPPSPPSQGGDKGGVPKVIDFGIAKALGQELTDKTLFTGIAQMVGTPMYVSPEQAGMSDLDVDTRSDVYSLGVLLYELLTGTTPFERLRFRQAAYDEIRRIVREEEPPKPSTRLSELSSRHTPCAERPGTRSVPTTLASVAAQRQTDPTKLTKLVRGELDWIVMKALEKDRDRRYQTANGLAMDIERYLSDEPVLAGPPSRTYQVKKFLKRNKGPVLAAGLVLATLAMGMAGTTWGLIEALQQRNTANAAVAAEKRAKETAQTREAETTAVLDFVENKVFASARPEGQQGGLGRNVTLHQALAAVLPDVHGSFSDQPLIEARLRRTLGGSFFLLGDAQTAAEQFDAVGTLYARHYGPDSPETLRSHLRLANCYAVLGRHAEALKLREQTLALMIAKLGVVDPDTLHSMNNLANSYAEAGRHDEALALREEALALRMAQLGPDHADTLQSKTNLAYSYATLGRHAEALKLREETLAKLEARLGPDHPDTLFSMESLAYSHTALGRHAEALRLNEKAHALRLEKLGPGHPQTLRGVIALANNLSVLGRHAEAVAMCRQALAIDPEASGVHGVLAWALRAQGDWPGAIAAFRRVTELRPEDSWNWYLLAQTHLSAEDREAHRQVCAEMMNRFGATRDANVAARLLYTLLPNEAALQDGGELLRLAELARTGKGNERLLGAVLYRVGKYEMAIAPLEKGQARAWDHLFLAMAHQRLGQVDKARAYLERAVRQIATAGYGWPESTEAELLRREAEALIEGKTVEKSLTTK